jgi:hypothetical protein
LAAGHAAADPLRLDSARVGFSEEDTPPPHIVGKLEFRGGIHLTSPDLRFGGWSGLAAGGDGATLTAISDNGYWLVFRPRYDATGRLVGVETRGEIGSLPDTGGQPVRGAWRDAEDLARLPDGFAVAFENRHRIWLYPDGAEPFAIAPRAVAPPLALGRAPSNRGIEALTALKDGRLLAITEGLRAGAGLMRGWIGDAASGDWAPLAWHIEGEFVPTGAATLPDGDVIVLQRRFSWIGGLATRLSRVAADDIRPGATLAGQEIARLEVPVVHENFEGIAVATRGRETSVYVISDDNYNVVLQRTLLLMFALSP